MRHLSQGRPFAHRLPERAQVADDLRPPALPGSDPVEGRRPDLVHGHQAAEHLGAGGQHQAGIQDAAQEEVAVLAEPATELGAVPGGRRAVPQLAHQRIGDGPPLSPARGRHGHGFASDGRAAASIWEPSPVGSVTIVYRIRWNHRTDSSPEASARASAAAENSAVTSVSFRSATTREVRAW